MTTFLPVKIQKQGHSSLNAAQTRFNFLQKQIEALRKDLENQIKRLDDCLNYYTDYICPQRNYLLHILKKQTKLLYPYYTKRHPFSKKQRACLKRFMLNRLDRICEMGSFDADDKEFVQIYEDLNNICYKDMVSEEFEYFRDSMQDMFAEEGLDVDFSDLNLEDGKEGVFRRMFESIDQKQENYRKREMPPRAKNQKDLEKEARKDLQKKEIGTIYKQLVKIIHPDLEQDPERKQEKEALMKKLSAAYEDNDLYTILSLEMEWLQQPNSPKKIDSAERFEIYNRVLQKQIQDLKCAIKRAHFHHKYSHLHPYLSYGNHSQIAGLMKKELSELQRKVKPNEELMDKLEQENAEKAVFELIDFIGQ